MNGEEVIEKLLVDINKINNERIRKINLHLGLLLLSIIIYILKAVLRGGFLKLL